MKTAHLAVQLPADLTEWIRIVAAKEHIRPRDIVAAAIKAYREQKQKEKQRG